MLSVTVSSSYGFWLIVGGMICPLNIFLDALYPLRCVGCHASCDQAYCFCSACYRVLPWNHAVCKFCAHPLPCDGEVCAVCSSHPPPWSRAWVPFRYEGVIQRLLLSLKFSQHLLSAKWLGSLLVDYIRLHDFPVPQALLPVPLHAKRLRLRGFNQSLELARPIARAFGCVVLSLSVKRMVNTVPQSSLSTQARLNNIKNAFTIKKEMAYEHVLLIDDVMTTGSTLQALALLLRDAGVRTIHVLCVARSILKM